ncbi:hypothetical protein WJX72_001889 [[Myrmecia] bisecta]|uniref:SMP-LTD domain-containing protein n=1 Tax=[Myrmecia] bisecta TaxID=41462 RepID=A0AAW1PH09_9CHLO
MPRNSLLLLWELLLGIPIQHWLTVAVASWLTWKVASGRAKTAMRSAAARWDALRDAEAQFSISESFTLGWFNVFLRQLWPTLLEKQISETATKVMKDVIAKVLKENQDKRPLKYVEGIAVEEFTLGLVPPRFHYCHARFSPAKNYMQLEAEMDFQSSGFQLVLAPKMRANPLLPAMTGRIEVTHLTVTGRCLLGFHLFSRPPGIKGLDFSFVQQPEIDVKFSPFGVTVTELPGVLMVLKDRVQKVLAKDMVEPRRNYTDLERLWQRKRVEHSSGPGGMLSVSIVQARDLRYPGSKLKSGALIDAYCELRYAGEVFRTPCVRGSGKPAWNWQFDIRLPEPAPGRTPGSEGTFRLAVLDAKAMGDPGLLGTAKLSLKDLDLQPNGPPRNMWLPLKGSPEGSIQVQLAFLIRDQAAASASTSPASSPEKHAAGGKPLLSPLNKGAPVATADTIENKEELASMLAAERSRRRLAEQRFSKAQQEAESLRMRLKEAKKLKGSSSRDDLHIRTHAAAKPAGPAGTTLTHRRSFSSPTLSAMLTSTATDVQPVKPQDGTQPSPSTDPAATADASPPLPPTKEAVSLLDASIAEAAAAPTEDSGELAGGLPTRRSTDDLPERRTTEDAVQDYHQARDGSVTPPDGLGSAGPSATSMAGSPGAIALLVKVSKLERLLRDERLERQRLVSEAEGLAAQLEAELAAERTRRLSEQLRALIEGARFVMHKSTGAEPRHVWFSPSTASLRWAMSRVATGAPNGKTGDVKNKERSIELKKIKSVEAGTGLFPSRMPQGWSGLKAMIPGLKKPSNTPAEPDEGKSFSIVFTHNSAIHLELPPLGNGRSREEWVAAFQDLATQAYKSLESFD